MPGLDWDFAFVQGFLILICEGQQSSRRSSAKLVDAHTPYCLDTGLIPRDGESCEVKALLPITLNASPDQSLPEHQLRCQCQVLESSKSHCAYLCFLPYIPVLCTVRVPAIPFRNAVHYRPSVHRPTTHIRVPLMANLACPCLELALAWYTCLKLEVLLPVWQAYSFESSSSIKDARATTPGSLQNATLSSFRRMAARAEVSPMHATGILCAVSCPINSTQLLRWHE